MRRASRCNEVAEPATPDRFAQLFKTEAQGPGLRRRQARIAANATKAGSYGTGQRSRS
jgi:hypothetical protein